MSAQFYNRMKGVADRLLNQYGHSIQLLSYDANNVETVLDTYQGIKSPITVENSAGSVIEGADSVVYVTYGTVTPDTTQFLRMDGTIWKIIRVAPVRPTDIGILYTLYVSHGG